MIRIFIADDHAIVRRGLRQIVASEPDLEVVGESDSAQEALRVVRADGIDVLVLDLSMPGLSGLELLKALRQEHPRLPILVLTMHSEEQYAVRVLKAGASGFLSKESAPEELVKAIRKVHGGGKYVSESLAEKLAYELERDTGKPLHDVLSDREFQVLRMIAGGKTASEIAQELNLSVKTVSTYRSRILEKMQMKNNAQLMHYALKNGLV